MAGRVLVVEDNSDEADIICDLVRDQGESCIWVQSDKDAYRALQAPEFIEGLVVDVNLGSGTTGFDVARFARQTKPSLPVIYVSGQVSATSFRAFGVPGSTYVEKPFSAEAFATAFREAFDEGQTTALAI